MINLTLQFADGTTTSALAAWFTNTYGFHLKTADEEGDCPTDILHFVATKHEADLKSVTMTPAAPEDEEQPEPKFLYFNPWHGRMRKDENLDDWGFDGPFIGPLSQVVFNCGILQMENPEWPAEDQPSFVLTHANGKEETIPYVEDMGTYRKEYFGDLSVIKATAQAAKDANAAYEREYARRQEKKRVAEEGEVITILVDLVPYKCEVTGAESILPNLWGESGFASVIKRHPNDEIAGEVCGIGVSVDDGQVFIGSRDTDKVIDVVRYINDAYGSVGWELLLP